LIGLFSWPTHQPAAGVSQIRKGLFSHTSLIPKVWKGVGSWLPTTNFEFSAQSDELFGQFKIWLDEQCNNCWFLARVKQHAPMHQLTVLSVRKDGPAFFHPTLHPFVNQHCYHSQPCLAAHFHLFFFFFNPFFNHNLHTTMLLSYLIFWPWLPTNKQPPYLPILYLFMAKNFEM